MLFLLELPKSLTIKPTMLTIPENNEWRVQDTNSKPAHSLGEPIASIGRTATKRKFLYSVYELII